MIAPRGAESFVEANGLRHRVLSYGDTGPEVLILTGITSTALTAEFIAVALADRFRVHVPDLRGRGGTPATPPGSYTLGTYAADVDGLVDGLGLSRPIVVGHSLGARIGAAHAVSRPGRQGGLVLVDPPLSGPGRDPYPTSAEAFDTQLHQAYRGTTEDELRAWYPRWDARELRIRAQELPTCDRAAVLETHANFHREDFLPNWRQLSDGVVLVRGADSPVVTDAGAAELRASNPAIPVVTVPDAGHMVPWDNWPAFRDVLLDELLRTGATSVHPD
ncbi:alpha/beta fold hydrolase [Pseudonocardia sp. CA-107938]|uniref:alpha/beta fold hydrolase n=1 Tax=Pseudonocardia sp. CA-107938 TaxID=3240021 RepID=UPI003D8D73F0